MTRLKLFALALIGIGCAVVAVPAQAQLWGGPGTEKAGQSPAGHDQMGTWQILALSPTAGKDAWTSQSMKEDRLAGYNDTLSRCNMILEKMRLPQRDCVAFASEKWVASYYCRQGTTANFGEGDSPGAAMQDAIQKAGRSSYCEFKAVRGPEHGMEMMIKPWQATCNCGDRPISLRRTGHRKVDSAVMAVNDAIIECGRSRSFQVVELTLAQ